MTIGESRHFLAAVMETEFIDRTFHGYIGVSLAGDFAFEIARLIKNREAQLTQLREALARAEGEREELQLLLDAQTKECRKAIDIGTGYGYRAEKAEQERDTLKAECEHLNVKLELVGIKPGEVVDSNTLVRKYKNIRDAIQDLANDRRDKIAQLTKAEEARKLCAVQMMGLEEERERLTRENRNLADRIQSGGIRIQLLTDQLTTSREKGHRAGMERAAVILRGAGRATALLAIVAESSTLPRTYEQGAEDMKSRVLELVERRFKVIMGEGMAGAIRALPTKEG